MLFKQLDYFVRVAELENINKAAESLFTSQPNVSKVINSLEREHNLRLFESHAKGVRLTVSGESFMTMLIG